MSEDQFTELFKYMTEHFAKIEAELARKADDSKVDRILNLLDRSMKQGEIDEHERLAMAHQLDRHEDWITKAASKLRVKYDNAP